MRNHFKQPLLLSILVIAFTFSGSTKFIFASTPGDHPGRIAQKISELKQRNAFRNESRICSIAQKDKEDELDKVASKYTLLNLNANERKGIMNTKPEYLKLKIPFENGARVFTLLLYKVDLSPDGFTLLTSDGLSHPLDNTVHYRGSIDGDAHSLVSISFTGDEMIGFISNNEGNYVLGKLKNNKEGKHIIYNDKNLIPESGFKCNTNTSAFQQPVLNDGGNSVNSTKCVNWYWETDYDVYVDKGSVANVTSFMQAIFNQVQTLYANDGITINLKTLFVWTSVDPYIGPSANSYLTQFGNYRTSFAGNVAHLMGYGGSGGVAWTGTLCSANSAVRMAYSSISSTYSTVPAYSSTVDCIAHEEGHVFGSPHTHECIWNGTNTAIDGCSVPSGCPNPGLPAGGGTIMSYCHMTSVGKNFSLGFGTQPLQLITYYLNSGTCLSSCSACTTPAQPDNISGDISVCPASSQTYSITPVSGATSYTWILPSGWTGSSTTTSITVVTGNSDGTISVRANNSCGSSTLENLIVTVQESADVPGPITQSGGSALVCPGDVRTYSVTPVAGVSYVWTAPVGANITSGQGTGSIVLSFTTGFVTSGTLSVIALNSCETSAARTLTISENIPSTPTSISITGGIAKVCPGDARTYSITSVSGVTYSWTVPTGTTITSGQGTNSIVLSFNSGFIANGTLSVVAMNGCGSSSVRSLTISRNVPSPTGSPVVSGGSAKVCPGDNRSYSVTPVSGMTYNWTVPAGAIINNGQGTSTVNVTFNSNFINSGTLRVTASNGCGTSGSGNLTISRNLPVQPNSISMTGGIAKVCPDDVRTYSVTSVAGVTYNWIAPAGAVITGGQGTNVINVAFTDNFTAAGTLSITANNRCGASNARTLTIYRNEPLQPGSISGLTSVCPGNLVTYSINAVPSAESYAWAVPDNASVITGQGTTGVSVLWDTIGGNVSVRSVNSCGNSIDRNLNVNILDCRLVENNLADPLAAEELNVTVFPNPFSSTAIIEFQSTDLPAGQAGEDAHAAVEVYSPSGSKVISLFNGNIEAGKVYKAEFHAETLAEGMYFYRIICNDRILNGRMILIH